MTLVEPASVLLETGTLAVFTKTGGGVDPVETNGLLEDADTERESGRTTRQQAAWQITVATSAVGDNFGEGDTVAADGETYTILDVIAKDAALTVFLLS
jgi:hypothetical protein